jgi:hypothetical protein
MCVAAYAASGRILMRERWHGHRHHHAWRTTTTCQPRHYSAPSMSHAHVMSACEARLVRAGEEAEDPGGAGGAGHCSASR